MTNPEAILQLARLTGRAEFQAALGIPQGEEPASLDGEQRARLQELVETRIDVLTTALLDEAMASDDVVDSGSATAYLQDRLTFLGDLISPAQRDRIAATFERRVAAWG